MLASASGETVKRKIITADAGNTEVVAAVTGKIIRVINFVLVGAGSGAVAFRSGTTALTGDMPVGSTTTAPGESMQGHFQTNPGENLNLELGGTAAVDGYVCYQEI